MTSSSRIAILGGGSWATAIAKILLTNNIHIHWYIRDSEQINFIKKHNHNSTYLSSVYLDISKITFYSSLKDN